MAITHGETKLKLHQQLVTLSSNVDKVNSFVTSLAEVSLNEEATRLRQAYDKAGSDAMGEEVTEAVARLYEGQNFEVVKMPIKELYDEQGKFVTDMDGFLSVSRAGHEFVVLIEAMHQVIKDDISKSVENMRQVQALIALLREQPALPAGHQLWRFTAGQLWQFRHCDTIWMMAGAVFSDAARVEAQAQGFRVTVLSGNFYSVQIEGTPAANRE